MPPHARLPARHPSTLPARRTPRTGPHSSQNTHPGRTGPPLLVGARGARPRARIGRGDQDGTPRHRRGLVSRL